MSVLVSVCMFFYFVFPIVFFDAIESKISIQFAVETRFICLLSCCFRVRGYFN